MGLSHDFLRVQIVQEQPDLSKYTEDQWNKLQRQLTVLIQRWEEVSAGAPPSTTSIIKVRTVSDPADGA